MPMKNIYHSATVVRWKLGCRYRANPMVSATRITHAIAAKMLAPIIVSFSTSRRATIEVPMRLPPHAGPGGGSSRNFLVTERIVTPHAPGADPGGVGHHRWVRWSTHTR